MSSSVVIYTNSLLSSRCVLQIRCGESSCVIAPWEGAQRGELNLLEPSSNIL